MPTVAPLDCPAHVERAAWLGDGAAFACADGTVRITGGADVVAHDGLTVAAPHDGGLLTGGEDGAVRFVRRDGSLETLHGGDDGGDDWIDAVASGPRGTVAWSVGKRLSVRTGDGALHQLDHERTVEGIGFAPKGLRVAAARYGGVDAHWPLGGASDHYHWDGAHLAASFSPDGAFLVSVCAENALHGWRLADRVDMRMRGYPSKVRDLSWSSWRKGDRWLATAGATCAVLWPFDALKGARSKGGGPMGREPLLLGERADQLTHAVACHPTEPTTAIGYRDGLVLMARHTDGAEVMLRRPGRGAVTSLAWHPDGTRLAFGTQAGEAGTIDLTS